ncbi:MFS family permease [Paenarthrobacter nitroguajacolicus]|uniref:MFS transporter n=1 Tax=Paenarthrobacter nitroguajacolicus TaxID=211146 RepID=UPI002856FDB9|nr:MFS transporter [Paenarthrobacter nitroguajacolicus]MDR6989242.1 MFS family permease [Paenarthrobacter nitroguajacolicus]
MTVSSVSLTDKRKAFSASLVGTSLEWYDFAIYSAAAALLFPRLFFPSSDSFTGVILAFSTYAVGYIARPLGALIFGRLGDRIGRKHVLVATLVLIGAATFLIGLLPTYETIGFWAPLILVLLRLAQGIGVGGELGVAVLYSNENGDSARRGFWSSASQVGPPAGNLLANAALAVISGSLSDEAFFSWGWRIAFLLSAVLVAFGLWIRIRLEDTPIAAAIQARGEQADAPLREVFRTESRGLVAAAFSRIAPDVTYALFTVFVYTYATMIVGFERSQVLIAVLIGSGVQIILIPCAGALTDRFNRRLVFGVAAAAAAIWPFIFFPLIEGGSGLGLTLGIVTGLIIHSGMYGPQGAFITDQFSPRLRSTGSSMGFAIGSTFGGAIAPLAFAALFEKTHSWMPIAVYIAVACAVSIIGMVIGRDYKASEDAQYLGAQAQATPVASPAQSTGA